MRPSQAIEVGSTLACQGNADHAFRGVGGAAGESNHTCSSAGLGNIDTAIFNTQRTTRVADGTKEGPTLGRKVNVERGRGHGSSPNPASTA